VSKLWIEYELEYYHGRRLGFFNDRVPFMDS
jgi:hypothetical protein